MNNNDPTTGAQPTPVETGGAKTPVATQPQSGAAATDDKPVTLSQKEYKDLIAARDRANNSQSELTDTVLTLAQEREINQKKDYLSDFLEQNKDNYPDLTVDDLMAADDPEKLEELAKAKQRRYEDVVQDRLLKVQTTSAPVLSPEDRAERLKKLKENPGKGAFGEYLELQQHA